MFEKFPYTNFHELNLDWMLKKIKKNEENIKEISEEIPEEIKKEVDAAVNVLIDSGKLEELVNQTLFDQLNEYIADIKQNLYNHGIFAPLSFIECGVGKQYADIVTAVRSCDSNTPTVILLYPGTYSTEIAQTDNSHYGLTLDNVFIVGIGARNSIQIISGSITEPASTLCLKNNSGLYNLFINGTTGRYTIHDDFHELLGNKKQFRRIVDCEIYASGNVAAQVYGSGIKSNQDVLIKNCYFYGFSQDAFRMHNMTGVDDESTLTLDNCFFVSNGQYAYHLILACVDNYNGNTNTMPVTVKIIGGNIDSIVFTNENSGNKSNVWRIYSDHAIEYNDLTNAYLPWKQFIRGASNYAVTPAAPPSIGDCVILASGAKVQKLSPGTGGSKYAYAAYGVCIRAPYQNIAFIVRNGVIASSLLGKFAVFDTLTIDDNGRITANGTGRKIGYVDALSNAHINFESI